MTQSYILKEGRVIGELLKQLPESDQNRIEGIIIGISAARETAQPPILGTAPQPTTTWKARATNGKTKPNRHDNLCRPARPVEDAPGPG